MGSAAASYPRYPDACTGAQILHRTLEQRTAWDLPGHEMRHGVSSVARRYRTLLTCGSRYHCTMLIAVDTISCVAPGNPRTAQLLDLVMH